MMISSVVFALGACATDDVDGDNDPGTGDPATSVDTAASTNLAKCAVGSNPNGTESITTNGIDTYLRGVDQINHPTTGTNPGCDCLAWQSVYDHQFYDLGNSASASDTAATNAHGTCRPGTWVDVTVNGLGVFTHSAVLGADVPTWGAGSQTECENSEIAIAIEQRTGVDAQGHDIWNPIWPVTAGNVYIFHPTWDASHTTCKELSATHVVTATGKYRVKAKAILGLMQYNHGYAGITIVSSAL